MTEEHLTPTEQTPKTNAHRIATLLLTIVNYNCFTLTGNIRRASSSWHILLLRTGERSPKTAHSSSVVLDAFQAWLAPAVSSFGDSPIHAAKCRAGKGQHAARPAQKPFRCLQMRLKREGLFDLTNSKGLVFQITLSKNFGLTFKALPLVRTSA